MAVSPGAGEVQVKVAAEADEQLCRPQNAELAADAAADATRGADGREGEAGACVVGAGAEEELSPVGSLETTGAPVACASAQGIELPEVVKAVREKVLSDKEGEGAGEGEKPQAKNGKKNRRRGKGKEQQ